MLKQRYVTVIKMTADRENCRYAHPGSITV